MFLTKLLITVSALLCLNTTTLFLNAQGRSDMPIADCEFKINKIRDSWKPVKDSIFRYTPFSLKNKGLNYEFLGRIGSLKECCCPTSLASIDSINKKFPKPDAIQKTPTLVKQYYFFRLQEYCNFKSKKLKLSDNIPYTIILIFDKKTDLLVDVITN